jgi:hypothetical protein
LAGQYNPNVKNGQDEFIEIIFMEIIHDFSDYLGILEKMVNVK